MADTLFELLNEYGTIVLLNALIGSWNKTFYTFLDIFPVSNLLCFLLFEEYLKQHMKYLNHKTILDSAQVEITFVPFVHQLSISW